MPSTAQSDHAAKVEAELKEAMQFYRLYADWSAESLALHTQAVLQGAFILAKVNGGAAIAAESIDHLRRYVELLFKNSKRKGAPRMTTEFVPYLAFDGECETAFKFYEKALRGEIIAMLRLADAPPDVPRTPETANRVMHARLKVGDRVLMGGDAPAGLASKPQGFCVSVQVDGSAEAERVFAELSAGGKVMMPIGPTFWAERFGMFTDKFGVPWMVNCEKRTG